LPEHINGTYTKQNTTEGGKAWYLSDQTTNPIRIYWDGGTWGWVIRQTTGLQYFLFHNATDTTYPVDLTFGLLGTSNPGGYNCPVDCPVSVSGACAVSTTTTTTYPPASSRHAAILTYSAMNGTAPNTYEGWGDANSACAAIAQTSPTVTIYTHHHSPPYPWRGNSAPSRGWTAYLCSDFNTCWDEMGVGDGTVNDSDPSMMCDHWFLDNQDPNFNYAIKFQCGEGGTIANDGDTHNCDTGITYKVHKFEKQTDENPNLEIDNER